MITLRDNQVEPIQKAIDFFKNPKAKPSLIVLPTAWGKSILTAYVAKETNDKILVLQPSKELLEQNYKKYLMLCGDDFDVNAAIYSASFNSRHIARVTYATIGSIKNIGETFKKYGFTKMLIDEAHLYPREADSMLGKFLADSGITHVLGITATPLKLQAYGSRENHHSKLVMLTSRSRKGNFYREIIHVGQVQEMVERRYWSPLRYEKLNFDTSELVFNTAKSEYTDESVKRAYDANNVTDTIDAVLKRYTDRRHVIVFMPSVEDAVRFASRYRDAAAIYGDMDKVDRQRKIEDFKAGKIRTIFNVRVLSTGFDFTGIDLIILGISTASIALYYQIIGRATRIDPGKTDALIVDIGGNIDRFGKVEDIIFEKGRQWRMYGTGGRLLTGVPIDEIGQKTRDDVVQMEKELEPDPNMVLTFGKYKDTPLVGIPEGYRRWMLEKFEWNKKNKRLRESLVASLRV